MYATFFFFLYFLLLSNKKNLLLKAAGPRSCSGAACASLQQYGFAIAAIPTALEPNRRRRLTHELVKRVQQPACYFNRFGVTTAIQLEKRK